MSELDPPAAALPARYRLLAAIGEGGMGAVFRAHDRLRGHDVALKRVALAPDAPADEAAELRLALAHEFRVLAGLRHPHIISVLDYGFDSARQPFFTMDLLEGARPLLEAGQDLPREQQVDLLLQALEALAYLHRRGVLHHDLKPANMLVAGGQLRLLDFGLAALIGQQRDDDAFGTLQYLAPEVLDGQPYREAADLYSLGVVAYELLSGDHPFPAESAGEFFQLLFESEPDLQPIAAAAPELAALVGALLEKAPSERPASAHATIERLRAAAGLPERAASAAIRESYLQAASFVGRAQELQGLTDALGAAARGQGSAWLVGGESGVGKSRLLDELRTHALVEGFSVLTGQAAEGGGAYQIWHEPLRALALTTPLSDLEAGVLAPIVPDIAALLGRAIPAAPELGGAESGQRLTRVLLDLLARQSQPLMLVLEDLQWADASLGLLQDLVRLIGPAPLLVVGSYRDDERPDLPAALPHMRPIALRRLDAASIADLSAAMLGESGRLQHVVALLERETEGNAFFMVEVARLLAEEAGTFAEIGRATLPVSALTGGVLRVVARRLERVPAAALPLLQLAATLGRQIDLAALRAAAPDADLDGWLLACAERQVLEVQGEQWRFSHDKVREGALVGLAPERRRALHREAALAIEGAYPERAPQAARLAEHFGQAGLPDRERAYTRVAGDYAARLFAHAEAARHYGRALALAESPAERFELLLAREESHSWRGDREAQAGDLRELAELAEALGDERLQLTAAQRQLRHVLALRDFAAVLERAGAVLALARALGDEEAEATTLLRIGVAYHRLNTFAEARAQLQQALEIARRHDLRPVIIDSLANLGMIADHQGQLAEARARLQQALDLSRELGDRQRESTALNGLSVNASRRGDQAARDRYLGEALQLTRQIGRPDGECVVLTNIGIGAFVRGDYDQAEQSFAQALPLARLIGDRLVEGYLLGEQGKLARALGDLTAARAFYERSLASVRALGVRDVESQILGELSLAAQELGELELAERLVREALAVAQAAELATEQQMAWLGLGEILILRGDPAQAAEACAAVLRLTGDQEDLAETVAAWLVLGKARLALGQPAEAAAQIERVLGWLGQHAPSELIDVVGTYLACAQVLAAVGDPRAPELLAAGRAELERQAATIGDPQRRARFLAASRASRELLAAAGG